MNPNTNGHAGARNTILAEIQAAVGDHKPVREMEYAAIARNYRRSDDSSRDDVLELLASRLRDYEAGVYHCAERDIAQTVEAAMAARGKTTLLRPQHFPSEWLPAANLFPPVDGMSYEEIDRGEGVITTCVTAIAFTGTIILRHGEEEGRRALTLIPDYHLCVVLANQVVSTVPEGLEKLIGIEKLPITTVSGPSATADIEMSRVKGVHGPRTLDVILAV
jgi:L-lactate dehydrogenase complex protein LldG